MFIMGKERDYIIHNDTEIKGFFSEYRFLSNFEVSDVYYEGAKYPSTENAYHAAKTLDEFLRQQFINIKPNEAKNLGNGRVLKGYPNLIPILSVRDNWDNEKYFVMFSICFDKFYRNLELRKKLLDTGDRYLEETNHWGDKYWGVCEGEGENNLGKILMSIRDIFKKNTSYSGIPLDYFNKL